jgi:hypothetical protein
METDANYQYVVSSASRAGVALSAGQANAVTTSASPANEVEERVTFTPETAVVGTAESYSTIVRFRTLTGGTETSDAVTLTRNNPAFQFLGKSTVPDGVLDHSIFNSVDIPPKDGTIYLYANTRVSWYAYIYISIYDKTFRANGNPGTPSTISISFPTIDKGDRSNWGSDIRTLGNLYYNTNYGDGYYFSVIQDLYTLWFNEIVVHPADDESDGKPYVTFAVTSNTSWEATFHVAGSTIASLSGSECDWVEHKVSFEPSAQERTVSIYNSSAYRLHYDTGYSFVIPATP